jgi:lipopolysaccharide/colanic/teichoic acid biosynthesis glycosyltransferase
MTGRARASSVIKRLFDLSVALLLAVLLLPVIVITAVAVRFMLGAPVLFRQPRPGLHGRTFTLIKFRTMRDAVDRNGQPLPDAQRLTRFGRMLRATSLDELPELWNVVRGEMSLVGPRPLLVEYLSRYDARQARRHDVRPGITGWAQVNGRNALSWSDRFELDVWYVENHSFALDVRILALTMLRVIRPEGVAQPGHVTMTPFAGNASTEHSGERAA